MQISSIANINNSIEQIKLDNLVAETDLNNFLAQLKLNLSIAETDLNNLIAQLKLSNPDTDAEILLELYAERVNTLIGDTRQSINSFDTEANTECRVAEVRLEKLSELITNDK